MIKADIISHQNKAGALFYTITPIYQNTETRKYLINEVDGSEYYKIINHNPDFPFSTYSDAVYYKDNVLPKEVTYKSREVIETEREFSPVRTALAIGLPTLGALTIILSMVFNPPDKSK